ncbi:hypothetical protein [Seinonella peptonophila]|nr:hypothetical protein [Seinonella peptonophila]
MVVTYNNLEKPKETQTILQDTTHPSDKVQSLMIAKQRTQK